MYMSLILFLSYVESSSIRTFINLKCSYFLLVVNYFFCANIINSDKSSRIQQMVGQAVSRCYVVSLTPPTEFK